MKRVSVVLMALVMAGMLTGCGRWLTNAEVIAARDFADSTEDMRLRIDRDPNAPGYVKTYAGGVALYAANFTNRVNNEGAEDPNDYKPSK